MIRIKSNIKCGKIIRITHELILPLARKNAEIEESVQLSPLYKIDSKEYLQKNYRDHDHHHHQYYAPVTK